jgi:hypothetical protein
MSKLESLTRRVSELRKLLAEAEEALMDAELEEAAKKDREVRDAELRPVLVTDGEMFLAQYVATRENGEPFQTSRLVKAASLEEARKVADLHKNGIFPLFSRGDSVYVSAMLVSSSVIDHDDIFNKVIEETPQW